jgi:hypothetical protein
MMQKHNRRIGKIAGVQMALSPGLMDVGACAGDQSCPERASTGLHRQGELL